MRKWITPWQRVKEAEHRFLRELNDLCPPGSKQPLPVLIRKVLARDWPMKNDDTRRNLSRKLLKEYHLNFPWIVEAVYTSVTFWVEHAGDEPPHPWNDRFVFAVLSDTCLIEYGGRLFEDHPADGIRPLPRDDPDTGFGLIGRGYPDPLEMSRTEFKKWALRTWDEHDDRAAQSPNVKKRDTRVRETSPKDRAKALAVWQVDTTMSKTRLARKMGITHSTLDSILKAEASILGIDIRPVGRFRRGVV